MKKAKYFILLAERIEEYLYYTELLPLFPVILAKKIIPGGCCELLNNQDWGTFEWYQFSYSYEHLISIVHWCCNFRFTTFECQV